MPNLGFVCFVSPIHRSSASCPFEAHRMHADGHHTLCYANLCFSCKSSRLLNIQPERNAREQHKQWNSHTTDKLCLQLKSDTRTHTNTHTQCDATHIRILGALCFAACWLVYVRVLALNAQHSGSALASGWKYALHAMHLLLLLRSFIYEKMPDMSKFACAIIVKSLLPCASVFLCMRLCFLFV